jgi:hypothetical protein
VDGKTHTHTWGCTVRVSPQAAAAHLASAAMRPTVTLVFPTPLDVPATTTALMGFGSTMLREAWGPRLPAELPGYGQRLLWCGGGTRSPRGHVCMQICRAGLLGGRGTRVYAWVRGSRVCACGFPMRPNADCAASGVAGHAGARRAWVVSTCPIGHWCPERTLALGLLGAWALQVRPCCRIGQSGLSWGAPPRLHARWVDVWGARSYLPTYPDYIRLQDNSQSAQHRPRTCASASVLQARHGGRTAGASAGSFGRLAH